MRQIALPTWSAALVGEAVREDQIESTEEMVEAILALAVCEAELTGRHLLSLDLIDELGLTVHALNGTSLEPGS